MRFLLGLGLGYMIGLLIAPASGQEFRRELAERADEYGGRRRGDIGQHAGEQTYQRLKKQL
jgi:gas vesicle protein